jgi:hypothetical protein
VIEVDAGHTTINRILLTGNREEWPRSDARRFCKRMLMGPEGPIGG